MIVDIHAHLFGENLPSKEWMETTAMMDAEISGKSFEEVMEKRKLNWDLSGDMIVREMDAAGIDKSVLLLIDYGFGFGTGEHISLEDYHRVYAEAVRRHPDRLIAFAGIDPRRPRAAQFLERAVKEWNMKGLKLHPGTRFYPNSNKCYLLYQKAQELGIPVILHTGPDSMPLVATDYSHPRFLDEVANDFPDLKIIMAHAGGSQWPDAAAIAGYNRNVYLDLALWQLKVLRRPVDEFYKPLRSMLDTAGRSKILFGSDFPGVARLRRLPHAAWVKVFTEIPEEVKAAGIEFREQEISGILGDNAANLLGLQIAPA